MIPSRSVLARHCAYAARPVHQPRTRLHKPSGQFHISIQGPKLSVRDTLLDEKTFQRISSVTLRVKNLRMVSFHDVHAEHMRIPQLFDACLGLVAESDHISNFAFTYSLSRPAMGIMTLADTNADNLALMLRSFKLRNLKAIDLTNNQFGSKSLLELARSILYSSSIDYANLTGHLADPFVCQLIDEATQQYSLRKRITLGRNNQNWAS